MPDHQNLEPERCPASRTPGIASRGPATPWWAPRPEMAGPSLSLTYPAHGVTGHFQGTNPWRSDSTPGLMETERCPATCLRKDGQTSSLRRTLRPMRPPTIAGRAGQPASECVAPGTSRCPLDPWDESPAGPAWRPLTAPDPASAHMSSSPVSSWSAPKTASYAAAVVARTTSSGLARPSMVHAAAGFRTSMFRERIRVQTTRSSRSRSSAIAMHDRQSPCMTVSGPARPHIRQIRTVGGRSHRVDPTIPRPTRASNRPTKPVHRCWRHGGKPVCASGPAAASSSSLASFCGAQTR